MAKRKQSKQAADVDWSDRLEVLQRELCHWSIWDNDHLRVISMRDMRSVGEATMSDLPGVVAIVGNSNEGKSNVVRGVVDVLTNRTGTESFTSHWANVGMIQVGPVALFKGSDKRNRVNEYQVQPGPHGGSYHDRGWHRFPDVGRGVPDEVLDVLNMRPVEFDQGLAVLLNVSEQRGPQFFVDHTPSQRAKIIGAVSGLEVVYRAVKLATDGKRAADKEYEVARVVREQAAAKLEGFDGRYPLEDWAKRYEAAKGRADALAQASTMLDGLWAMADAYDASKAVVGRVAPRLTEWTQRAERLAQAAEMLAGLQTAWAEFQRGDVEAGRVIEEYQATARELESLEQQYTQAVAMLTECPTCGGALNESQRNALVEVGGGQEK